MQSDVSRVKATFYPALAAMLERKGVKLYRYAKFDPIARSEGRDWPVPA
jgi:hypothetical protein